MGFLLLLLVIVGVGGAYFWFHKKSATTADPLPVSNRFHAVTIRFQQDACPAVRALANTKYVAKEAPRLPLDACTASTCHCEYQHYDDRRDHEDRRGEAAPLRYEGQQRRHSREDRRKSHG